MLALNLKPQYHRVAHPKRAVEQYSFPMNQILVSGESHIARAILLKKSDFIGVSLLCSFAQAFVTQLLRSFLAADRDYIYLCSRR